VYGKGKPTPDTPKPKQLINRIEKVVTCGKSDWPIHLLREFWNELKRGITRRGRSVDHEITWLSMTGYCLRPGYGYEGDEQRIAELWRLYELGPSHRKEARVAIQWWILWRRVAGGLSQQQQECLYTQAQKVVAQKGDGYLEAYRLLGALERVPSERRITLAEDLVTQFSKGRETEATVWAFGRLASRVPAYADSSAAIPPSNIEEWFSQVADSSWSTHMKQAFRLAARCAEHDVHNLSVDVRKQVKKKLLGGGVSEEDLVVLDKYVPLKPADERNIYGEELPLGLTLSNANA
jgi:hypothetical protein